MRRGNGGRDFETMATVTRLAYVTAQVRTCTSTHPKGKVRIGYVHPFIPSRELLTTTHFTSKKFHPAALPSFKSQYQYILEFITAD